MGGDFDIFGQIQLFLEKGGPVLNAIMVITFFMWALIMERFTLPCFTSKSLLMWWADGMPGLTESLGMPIRFATN